jgi:hypothetical protein
MLYYTCNCSLYFIKSFVFLFYDNISSMGPMLPYTHQTVNNEMYIILHVIETYFSLKFYFVKCIS